MTITYEDTEDAKDVKGVYDPLAHPDAQFINVIYMTPVGDLVRMDTGRLRESLAKVELVYHWLEGVLAIALEFEQTPALTNKKGE